MKQDVGIQTRVDWCWPQPERELEPMSPIGLSPNETRCAIPEEEEEVEEEKKKIPDATGHILGQVELDLNQLGFLHGQKGSWKSRLRSISLDLGVRWVMNLVVITNVFILGVQAASEWSGWLIVDLIYAVFFVAEILYKVAARGGLLIFCPRRPDWRWNLFDLFLAVVASFEVIVGFLDLPMQADGVNAIRSMRLVRITRVLRLIPFEMREFVSDLMMMIDGALAGVRTLFWSILLMTLPVYVFALILTETLGAKNAGRGEVGWEFNTMARSMFTSFRCLVGGDCSAMDGTPLFAHIVEEHGWFFGALFCFTQVCMSFGLFNVIISVYVENVIENAKHNDHLQKQRRLSDKKRMSEKSLELIYMLWSEVQKTNLGTATFVEKPPKF